MDALYEVVGKAPILFTKDSQAFRVRKTFIKTGAICKDEESGQYYPIPNLDVMISQCKVRNFLK